MKLGATQFLTLCGVTVLGATLTGFSPEPARRALPGDLPKPPAQMTSAELFAFGASLRFDNGPVQERTCARGGCMGRIDAVRDQVPGPALISANGTIVARLVNLGRDGVDDGPENRYGTAPGQNEFYVIALKSGDGWTWSVREAVRNAGNAPRETVSGTWTTCRHDPNNPSHPKGRSQFASCTTGAGEVELTRAAGPRPPRDNAAAHIVLNPLDPGWLICSDGCCTAGT